MKNNASLVYNVGLLVGDILALVLAFTIAYILRVSLNHTPVSTPIHAITYIAVLAGLIPFWLIVFGLLGLYNIHIYEQRFNEIGRIFIGTFIGILFIVSFGYITNTKVFPARLVILYSFALAFIIILAFRNAARGTRRLLFNYGIGINNVLIVGNTPIADRLIESIAETKITGYKVVGIVNGHGEHSDDDRLYRYYDSFSEAIKRVSSKRLHTIIQTELYADNEKNDEIVTYAQENHVSFRFVPGNSELFVGKIEVDLFQSMPIIAIHQTALIGWGRVVKRLNDIFIGGLLLIIALPIMLILAIAVKLSDGGPIFYSQVRLTRFNRKFKIYKFRTIKNSLNKLSPEEAFQKIGREDLIKTYRQNGDALDYDPRLTKVGRLIRRYSLDELPQFYNIVKGDLSLVGPRALIADELNKTDKKNLILSVKSGLTGLAQISGVRNLSFDQRRQLDLYYVQNWSPWSDIVIFIKTIWVVLFHRGARG